MSFNRNLLIAPKLRNKVSNGLQLKETYTSQTSLELGLVGELEGLDFQSGRFTFLPQFAVLGDKTEVQWDEVSILGSKGNKVKGRLIELTGFSNSLSSGESLHGIP